MIRVITSARFGEEHDVADVVVDPDSWVPAGSERERERWAGPLRGCAGREEREGEKGCWLGFGPVGPFSIFYLTKLFLFLIIEFQIYFEITFQIDSNPFE